MKRVIWLIFGVSLLFLLNGCFVPEQFESKVDIQKDGSYKLTYDGTMIFAPAFGKKLRSKDEKRLENKANHIKKDPNVKDAKYLGNARYQIKIDQSKKAGQKAYIFDRRTNLISVVPKGDTINISTKKLKDRDIKKIKKLNLKVDGKLIVSIPDNMKMEGTKPDSTPSLGFGDYEWDIKSFDKPIEIKITPKK